MLISCVYYAIRTSAILTSLNVGLCGTDRRFIFGMPIILYFLYNTRAIKEAYLFLYLTLPAHPLSGSSPVIRL